MNKFVKYLILILTTCYLTGNAQSDEPIQERRYIAIGITPLNLFEPITPTIEATVDFKVSERTIIEGKFGAKFPKIYNSDTNSGASSPRLNDKYHELKLGIKWKTYKSLEKGTHFYWGFEYLRLDHSFFRGSGIFRRDGTYYNFSNSDITRKINSLRLTFSRRAPISEKFKWEFYFGFGAKTVNVKYSVPTPRWPADGYDLFIHAIATKEGLQYKPDFIIGVKFMYEIFTW